MANVPIRHRMRRSLNLDTFTDELHTDVGSAAFVLSELVEATGHDYFSQEDLVIRTASGGGGTLLVLNTHYTLSEENTSYSTLATNAAGSTKTIYKKIQIIDAAYQSGDLYFSGKYFTDYLDPYDLNNITRKIVAVSGVYTMADLPGNNIYAITTGAGSFAFNTPDPTKNIDLEILAYKADTGAGICTATPNGADTYMGATAFPLRKYGDKIHLKSDGTNWYVLDSLSTLDSIALTAAATINTAHETGVMPRHNETTLVCVDADANFAADDETTPLWGATSHEQTIAKDATNIIVNMLGLPRILNKTTHAAINCTTDKWKYRHRISI